MELILKKEILEDGKLIQTPDDVVSLQDAVACVKQYEKFLQSKKRKSINIAYQLGYILHKIIESKEFIDMVKELSISKNTVTLKINLYKLFKKFPLLKQSAKPMYYFKKFSRNLLNSILKLKMVFFNILW